MKKINGKEGFNMEELMVEFYALLDEGIAKADAIRLKYPQNEMLSINEVQAEMKEFTKEREVPALVGKILEAYPSKRYELQKAIMAFYCEGKKVNDSLVR